MAAIKKYEGLPDLDLGTEIYESAVPELTEGSTQRTESPSLSYGADDDDYNVEANFDRRKLDREGARRRFEPALVDARRTNFSDTVAGNRRDYRTSRRRRHTRRKSAGRETADHSSDDDDYDSDEDETLKGRLARLRREAEEVKAEIDRLEQEKQQRPKHEQEGGEFEESVEEQQLNAHTDGEDQLGLVHGVQELERVLNGLNVSSNRYKKGETLEEDFMRKLDGDKAQQAAATSQKTTHEDNQQISGSSSVSAIAAFADRLTALETSLGISSISPTTFSGSILPTLDTLSSQINALSAVLLASQNTATPRSYSYASNISSHSTPDLDGIQDKLRTLLTESKRLEDSRKSATQALEELVELRERHELHAERTTANQYRATMVGQIQDSPALSQRGSATSPTFSRRQNSSSAPITSPAIGGANTAKAANTGMGNASANDIVSNLFLDEQRHKIDALYNLLPNIESLQPLLPLVLDRLRALHVLHAGAATAKEDLEDVEARLGIWEAELEKWRTAVEDVEKVMEEGKEVMKENVAVVGGMVRGVEERLDRLK